MKYNEFINKCKNKNYLDLIVQKHHIIPKSNGGNDSEENIVYLSVHDHFWAHVYYAIDTGKCKTAPGLILHTYCAKKDFSENEWDDAVKVAYELQSELMKNLKRRKGWKHSEETKQKMSKKALGNKRSLGRKDSNEVKEKRASSLRGRKNSEESKNKMSLSAKLRPRKKHSEETKLKIGKSHLGKKRSDSTKKKQSENKKGRTWKLINGKRMWSPKKEII